MPELRFAITQQQKSVTGSHWYMDNWLKHYLHWQYWLKNLALTQTSFQTPSQPFYGWMAKPALPV